MTHRTWKISMLGFKVVLAVCFLGYIFTVSPIDQCFAVVVHGICLIGIAVLALINWSGRRMPD